MHTDELSKTTGAEVRAGLARRNLTQQQLGEHLGISRTAIGHRLAGTVPFKVPELLKTATFIGVPLEQLLPIPSEEALTALAEEVVI
jgi:transcriptional regulator with XRE-family HTH domain